MMDTTSIRRGGLLAALVLAALTGWVGAPTWAAAQEWRVVTPSGTGWIGFRYTVAAVAEGTDGSQPRIVVERIVDGSPAEKAGLRPGDVLLRINGRDATPAVFERIGSRLSPGDSLALEVKRGEWERTFTLTAARLPASGMTVALPRDFALRVDSTLQRLDSLSIQISTVDGVVSEMIVSGSGEGSSVVLRQGIRLRQPPNLDSAVWNMRPFETQTWTHHVTVDPEAMDVGISFPVFVYERQPDSLRAHLKSLEEASLQARDATRRAELQAEIRRLQGILQEAMAARTSALAGFRETDPDRRREAETTQRAEAVMAGATTLRPLNVYMEGENRVAGAQLTALNPDLAAYFDVESGLLVTDVIPGTPAAEAGLEPGDVIRRVGGAEVSSLRELRRLLARRHEWPVPVILVRQGQEMELSLPR